MATMERSRNRSEATVADYAVMHADGVHGFIYTTVSAEHAAYIAGHSEATVAIAEREFLPKLRSVRGEPPKLRQIIVIDGEADDAIGWPQLRTRPAPGFGWLSGWGEDW